jgi:cyclophilin family peptidyl-prolyl cis-trans isomerase
MKKMLFALLCFSVSLTAVAKKKSKNKFVEVETTMGIFKLELFNDVPQHSANFLKLAQEGFYDSLLFHRVIQGFMIQGGDPQSKNAPSGQPLGSGDVGYKVPAEFMLPRYYHKKGALCAARDNNPEKASSGCQFYVVVGKTFSDEEITNMETRTGTKYSDQARIDYKTIGGTPHLDGAYTVYGQCVSGQEVIDKIAVVAKGVGDRPIEDIRILKMIIKKK